MTEGVTYRIVYIGGARRTLLQALALFLLLECWSNMDAFDLSLVRACLIDWTASLSKLFMSSIGENLRFSLFQTKHIKYK